MTRRIPEKTAEAIALVVFVLWICALHELVDISVAIGMSSLTLFATALVYAYNIMDTRLPCIEALTERGDIL